LQSCDLVTIIVKLIYRCVHKRGPIFLQKDGTSIATEKLI
jgi:hypothetical protein